MHAVFVTVNIAPGHFESSAKELKEHVVPQVSKAPGLVKGYWAAASDHSNGVSLVVFKSKSDAENAAKMVRSNPTPQGVTITNVEIREVMAEA